MHWIQILGLVVAIVLVASFLRAKPDDTRQIQNTRLMSVGKVFLGVILLLLVVAYFVP